MALRVRDWEKERTFALALDLGGAAVPSRHDGSIPFLWPQGSLYPVLIAQLIAAVTHGERLITCSTCGRVIDWHDAGYGRVPQSGRGAYCGDACRYGARLLSIREYKRRRRQEPAKEVQE
jgi:hypothetical protein